MPIDTRTRRRPLRSSCLKKGGKAYIFTPSRNTVFARLNMLLPEYIKRKLLFKLFPHKAGGHDGFKAYYDKCTPEQLKQEAIKVGLKEIKKELFWSSSYFRILFPVFLLWRLWQLISFCIIGENAAETLIYVFEKE